MKARLLSILVGIAVVISLSTGAVSASDPPGTVTLQPGPGLNDGSDDGSADKGKDAWATGSFPTTNFGSATTEYFDGKQLHVLISTCNPWTCNAYIQFSLADMPEESIVSAEVQVYTVVFRYGGGGWAWQVNPIHSLRRVTSDWNEMTLIWDNQPTYDSAVIDSHLIAGVQGQPSGILFEGWLSYDITELYKGWADSSIPNYGVRFSQDNDMCSNSQDAWILSSDWPDSSLRPKLVVTGAPGGNIKGDYKGDYNGDGKVTELDALAALKMSVKQLPEDLALDMDGNGKVTAEDARLILKKALGK